MPRYPRERTPSRRPETCRNQEHLLVSTRICLHTVIVRKTGCTCIRKSRRLCVRVSCDLPVSLPQCVRRLYFDKASGRNVRWKNKLRMVVCSCDLDLESLCEGNHQLNRGSTKGQHAVLQNVWGRFKRERSRSARANFMCLSIRANFVVSGAHSGSCLRRLFCRTFWIVTAALVFLYFGSCLWRLFSCILDRACGACFLVFWIVPAALVFLYSGSCLRRLFSCILIRGGARI